MARDIIVNKLFAAVMTAGPDKDKRVLISPLETGNVQFLNDQQLGELANSGSITLPDDSTGATPSASSTPVKGHSTTSAKPKE